MVYTLIEVYMPIEHHRIYVADDNNYYVVMLHYTCIVCTVNTLQ